MPTQAQAGRGIGFSADPKSKRNEEEGAQTITLRNFGGVNVQSPRESIGDDEFAWLEELIPIAPGNLVPTPGPGSALVTIAGETGAPTLSVQFSLGGVDTVLAVWSNSGNAWIGAPTLAATWVKIATGTFTSGKTAAAPWSNTGVLIVDPTAGYFDYNVTAANTLTVLSGQLYNIAVSAKNATQLEMATVPSLRVSDPTGTGGTIGISTRAISVASVSGGSGYAVGDTVQFSGGTLTTTGALSAQLNQPTVVGVTAVNTSGAITGLSILSVGYYQVAPTGTISTVTGGAGSGATFTANFNCGDPYIVTAGKNYTAPVVQAFIGGVWVNYSLTIATSGAILGSAIAVYSGRVWIAINRTVQFTDAGSYFSLANSGSAFTINDSYLHNSITALYAANNYLYIFGDDSIDILSNVTVVGGLAQFSRINITASIGTNQQLSVFPYARALAFANNSGFYLVSGATPEKVSDKLDTLITAINFSSKVWGAQVMVSNILCAAFLFQFTDVFVGSGNARYMMAVLFRGKWWFTSQFPALTPGVNAILSFPVNGLSTLFGWSGNSFYQLLSAGQNNTWLLQTKLWDAETPILDKQGIQAGLGAVYAGGISPGVVASVDTEYASVLTTIGGAPTLAQWVNIAGGIVPWTNASHAVTTWAVSLSGYAFLKGVAANGGGKYMGLTLTGSTNTLQIRIIAVELERRQRW